MEDKNSYNYMRSYNNRTTVYVTYASQPEFFRVEADASMRTLDTLRNDFSFLAESGGGSAFFLVNNLFIDVGVNAVFDVYMSGKTNVLQITNWGWAPLHFENLEGNEVVVTHHGLSNVFVNARDVLNVKLFCSGNVYYRGNPSITEERYAKGKLYRQ